MMKQAKVLSGRPHFIVATPGRLADLIESSPDCIHVRRLSFLVLDEADRLLEPSFGAHLGVIFKELERQAAPGRRPQMLLFSATLTREMTNAVLVCPGGESVSEPLDIDIQPSVKRVKNAVVQIPDFLRLSDPFIQHTSKDFEPVENLIQKYLFIPSQVRDVYLVYLLKSHFQEIKSMIIFAGKCKYVVICRICIFD